jgi:hypothetical protein
MTWYHIVEEVPLSELSIFQWKGKCVGASSAHYVMDDEWNYTMLYMYMNMEQVQLYFKLFDKTYWKQSGQPTLNYAGPLTLASQGKCTSKCCIAAKRLNTSLRKLCPILE